MAARASAKRRAGASERLLRRGAARWAWVRGARWSGPAVGAALVVCGGLALWWSMRGGAWAWWIGAAAAGGALGLVGGLAWWRRPGRDRVAGWLDDGLELQDSLGTRLHLESAGRVEDPWARHALDESERRAAGRKVAPIAPSPWRGAVAWWSAGIVVYAGACLLAPEAAARWAAAVREAEDADAEQAELVEALDPVAVERARAELTAIANELGPADAAELRELERELAELTSPEGGEAPEGGDPTVRLSSVHERVQEQAQRDAQAQQDFERRLSGVESGEPGPADDLESALRRGDLEGAAEAYERLLDQVDGRELDADELAALEAQAKRIAEQLEAGSHEAAEEAERVEEAAREFAERQGIDAQASDALEQAETEAERQEALEQAREQAERAAQRQGQSAEQAQRTGEEAARELDELDGEREAAERSAESLDEAGEGMRGLQERAAKQGQVGEEASESSPAGDAQEPQEGAQTADGETGQASSESQQAADRPGEGAQSGGSTPGEASPEESQGQEGQGEQGPPEPGEQPGEQRGEQPGEQSGEQSGDQPGASGGQQPGEPPGQTSSGSPAESGSEPASEGSQESGNESSEGQDSGGASPGEGEREQALRRLAERARETDQRRETADRLQETLQRLTGGAEPSGTPSPGYGEGSVDPGSAPPRGPWDFETEAQREGRVGQGAGWTTETPGGGGSANGSQVDWDRRVGEAQDAAERAVTDDRLPRRYHGTVREYFRRLPDAPAEALDGASGSAGGAGSAGGGGE